MKRRKTFYSIAIILLSLGIISFQNADAQSSKKEEKNSKAATIKQLIESKNYAFMAQSVNPLRGSTRQLTPEYDVRVLGDSLVTYLPYFGRAYTAPINSEGGIKLSTTNFDYKVQPAKKGGYDITFVPTNDKDVRQLRLSVSANGYAQLQVISNNRDAISFNGYVAALPGRK